MALFQLPDPDEPGGRLAHVLFRDSSVAVLSVVERLDLDEEARVAPLVAAETHDAPLAGLAFARIAVLIELGPSPRARAWDLKRWAELAPGFDDRHLMGVERWPSAPMPDGGDRAPLSRCAPQHAGAVPTAAFSATAPSADHGACTLRLCRFAQHDIRNSIGMTWQRRPSLESAYGALVAPAHPDYLVTRTPATPPALGDPAAINRSGREYWAERQGTLPSSRGGRLRTRMLEARRAVGASIDVEADLRAL